jgi:hydrogen peroxide-dependent heme synthase
LRHPDVPESLEGWWILHRMFAFDRRRWEDTDDVTRARVTHEAAAFFAKQREREDADLGLAQIVGNKGDLMLTHYARTFEGLPEAEMLFDRLELSEYLEQTSSYVSVLELGLYEATGKIHAALRERALKPYSPEWTAAFDEMLSEQGQQPRNAGRLWARIPQRRYVCFYPMDKRRGEETNWYSLPYEERARLMLDHGKIGRSFHGLVTQVISGSIGFDDFEWGVDLYADDPLIFKKLIYEMRFDEASAKYGIFGEFFSGVQFSVDQLGVFLDGAKVPALNVREPAEV